MIWLIIFVHCKKIFINKQKTNFYSNRYDESVFDNPELPESNDHDFEWNPINIEQNQQQQPQELEKDLSNKLETTPPTPVTKTRKRPTSPSSLTPNNDNGRRSGRQKNNTHTKDDEEQQQIKSDKRKSVKDSSRISTRSLPNNDSIGTRLRGQK
jgi:hypothetical protein